MASKTYPVKYHGMVPDTFTDDSDIEVVVEGRWEGDGVIRATDVLAKCGSGTRPLLKPEAHDTSGASSRSGPPLWSVCGASCSRSPEVAGFVPTIRGPSCARCMAVAACMIVAAISLGRDDQPRFQHGVRLAYTSRNASAYISRPSGPVRRGRCSLGHRPLSVLPAPHSS